MTYEELKTRLTSVETTLHQLQTAESKALTTTYVEDSIKQLNIVRENILSKMKILEEGDETMFVSTKGGDTKAVQMDRKAAMDLKKDPAITGIDTAKGAKIKEDEGIKFSKDETKSIAKSVGKALIKALKKAGDEVARIKAHRLEEGSFDIHIIYKGESGEDEFSFYITDDTLHLVDFSFDKKLVEVGVKPSGEAIVNIDVLANEFMKHFRSLNEGDYDPDQMQKDDEEDHGVGYDDEGRPLGEGYEDTKGKALYPILKAGANATGDEVEMYVKSLAKDIELNGKEQYKEFTSDDYVEDFKNYIADKSLNEGEGDDHHYIKVKAHDYKKAMAILDQNVDPTYVKMEVVDNDGAGNVIIYFIFKHEAGFDDMYDDSENPDSEFYQEPDEDPQAFIYDVVMDLRANDIELADHSADMDEAVDNSDWAMKIRNINQHGRQMKKLDKMKKVTPKINPDYKKAIGISPRVKAIIDKLEAKRAQVMRDMEQEAEPQGGPISDKYGDMLNKIDTALEKARGGKVVHYDDRQVDTSTNENAIDPAEYGDIGKGYLAGFKKQHTLSLDQLEQLGRKIVKQIYKGDFQAAKAKHLSEAGFPDDSLFTFGFDLDEIQYVVDYLQANYSEQDYELHVGRGDTHPNAVTLINPKMEYDAELGDLLDGAKGSDQTDYEDYRREEDDYANNELPEETKKLNESASRDLDEIFGALGYRQGFDEFIEDNPGCVEVIMEWIGGISDFQEKLSQEYDNEELENLGFYFGDDDYNESLQEGRGDLDTIVRVITDMANEDGITPKEAALEIIEAIRDAYIIDAYDEGVVKESLNPEVSKSVDRFIKAMAKRYGYGDQDAVYAIMAALKQRNFDGVKEGDGLWANINAKKKRGEKASHGNSKAFKAAKKAGKALAKTKESVLKEYTDQSFKGSEVIDDANKRGPDMFGKGIFAELLPKGVASENDAVEALKKHDKSGIKARMGQYAPMFVHLQYHDIEHEGVDYRMHQTQYYNSNFKDKDPDFNPAVSKITLFKVLEKAASHRESNKEENLGTIIVKTAEYVQDLRNLPGLGKRVSEVVNELDGNKSKELVKKAVADINGAMFNFRHSNPLKMIAAKDKDLKVKLDAMHNAIFDLEKVLKAKNITEAKGGQIMPGDYVKNQHGNIYQRVDGKVGKHDAYVRVTNGKAGKKKTGLHDSFKLTLVNKSELTEASVVEQSCKVGDILTKDGKKGKVIKHSETQATVDFGNGDVYGIAHSRIKDGKILKEATRQDLGMSSSVSKRRAKAELKKPGNDGSKVYGLDKEGKRVHIKNINDVDKFKKFELDADLNEVIKEEATCCGKCGRVHVKGNCKRPYLKGAKHCRTK